MTNIPLTLAALLNLWITVGYVMQNKWALAVVFFCYGIACLGYVAANLGMGVE